MSQAIFTVFILSFCLTSIFRHSSFIMCLIFFKCMSITNVYQNSSLLSYYDYGLWPDMKYQSRFAAEIFGDIWVQFPRYNSMILVIMYGT